MYAWQKLLKKERKNKNIMNAYIKLFAIVQYIDYNIHVHLFLFYSIVLIYKQAIYIDK
jgi:hypothetical protein